MNSASDLAAAINLLVGTPNANLSAGMRHLNGVYTQLTNRVHGRVGHVFQGRFKAIVVDKDNYLLALARYVVLNPVSAGIVQGAGDCPFEFLCCHAGSGVVTRPRVAGHRKIAGLLCTRTTPAFRPKNSPVALCRFCAGRHGFALGLGGFDGAGVSGR